MASTPWSVSATKRKATPTTMSNSRKRQRMSDVVPATSIKRQQTLTQAQWIPRREISLEDSDDLTPIEPTPRPPQHGSKRRQKNTTLTQMDFFDTGYAHPDELEDDMEEEDDGAETKSIPIIPQADGGYDSPRKQRRCKSSLGTISNSHQSKGKQGQGLTVDSQGYKPSKRKRATTPGLADTNNQGLRRSSRKTKSKMKVFSDPAENLDYFTQALSPAEKKVNKADKINPPSLEIMESMHGQFPEDNDFSTSKENLAGRIPKTPQKQRTIILSSQSPESLPPSTKRRRIIDLDEPLGLRRTPLQEKSTNVVAPSTSKKRKLSISLPDEHAPKRKIVTLKVPKRRLSRQKPQIEDSQFNIWSIPITSSSSDAKSSPEYKEVPTQPITRPAKAVRAKTTEIPSTSETEEILPSSPPDSSFDLLPNPITVPELRLPSQSPPSPEQIPSDPLEILNESVPGVAIRDFALPHRDSSNTFSTPRQQQPLPKTVLYDDIELFQTKDNGNDDDAAESDFGSPVANDTQFNLDLDARTSSPDREHEPPQELDRDLEDQPKDRIEEALSENPATDGSVLRDPVLPNIPQPRLVSSSSPQARRTQSNPQSSFEEFVLPKIPLQSHPSSRLSTTMIPLKGSHATSSPQMLRSRSTTQKSMYPASIPHPSQISTQEATQGVFLQSSMPNFESVGGQDSVEKITVKDSSPDRRGLSQIPQYTGSQSQINLDLEMKIEDNDEEDYDLDPSSDAPLQYDLPDEEITPKAKPVTLKTNPPRHEPDNEDDQHEVAQPPQDEPQQDNIPSSQIPSTDSVHPETQLEVANIPPPANNTTIPSSPTSSSSISIHLTPPRPLRRQYTPIPGFDNETQSNFTQNGHVTAAYIHRQREDGALPLWFTPKPYQVPGYRRH